MTTPTEGVIRFDLQHRQGPLPRHLHPALAELAAWRDLLVRLGGIGQDPTRYDGAGFGNLSARIGPFPGPRGQRPFLISATQTGGEPCADPTRFALVRRCDARTNHVESEGPARPSSESLTHGALYDQDPAIRYVFHIHSPHIWRTERATRGASDGERLAEGQSEPRIWRARAQTRLPTTQPDIPYGTPAMAQEMNRLAQAGLLARRIIVMAGHEDGVIGFGHTAEEAGMALISAWARARAHAFEVDGGICVDRLG